jgi:hypothetical protein
MISIGLCGVAFLLCAYMGRKSLVAGLCALITVGYAYGIVRANRPDGFSHLIFDAGTLGFYLTQLGRRQPFWQYMRAEDARNWLIVLIAWPFVLFAMPCGGSRWWPRWRGWSGPRFNRPRSRGSPSWAARRRSSTRSPWSRR